MRYELPRALPRRSLAASALLTAALLTPTASAQDRVPAANGPGFDTHLFRPAVDAKGFFTVNGVDTLGSGNISFGLVTDYAHNLLRQPSGSDPDALVTHSFQGTFSFNVGLWQRLVLGVHVPVDLLNGDATTPIGPAGAKYESANLDAQKVGFVAPHLTPLSNCPRFPPMPWVRGPSSSAPARDPTRPANRMNMCGRRPASGARGREPRPV